MERPFKIKEALADQRDRREMFIAALTRYIQAKGKGDFALVEIASRELDNSIVNIGLAVFDEFQSDCTPDHWLDPPTICCQCGDRMRLERVLRGGRVERSEWGTDYTVKEIT